MSFWKKMKMAAIGARLEEERLYEQVLREIGSGSRRDGLWAKALEKSAGEYAKAKSLYIEYRVQSLKDELELITSATPGPESSADHLSQPYDPINAHGDDGYTPLMRATKAMDVAGVKSLLMKGANPLIRDNNLGNSTAINMAKLSLRRAKTDEQRSGYGEILKALEQAATL